MQVARTKEVPGLEERLKAERERYCKANSMTVATFAVSCLGMTPQNLYRIEKGKQTIDEGMLRKMEQVLGVSFNVNLGEPWDAPSLASRPSEPQND